MTTFSTRIQVFLSESEVPRHPGHGDSNPKLPGVRAPGGASLGRLHGPGTVDLALIAVTQHNHLIIKD